MGEKEKNTIKRILVLVISLTLITYIIYQAYMMIYQPVKTEIARTYTASDIVDTDVFVAREESYIKNSAKGTIISVVDGGSRVAKNQEVALVFNDTASADTYTRLNELSNSIERYKRLANQTDNYTFDINDLDDNIDGSVMNLADAISSKKMYMLSDSIDNVRNQVVTRQVATGNTFDFDKKLEKIQSEYDTLSKKTMKYTPVISDKSGYYISGVDGYENLVDCSKVRELTVDQVYEILKSAPLNTPKGAIGKVVTEFTWYFICVVDSNSIGNMEVGDTLTVNLPFSAVNSVEATVYAINENNGDKTAVILSCNRMNSDISSLRHENAELVIGSYTGLKISASSIRVNDDGEKGVFVQNGNLVKFKKVNIIYANDDFVLSKADENADGYVKLYDNIITEGKDLYDGKIIK